VAGQLAAFLGVSALIICTPGQDTALTVRNTLAGGRGAGLASAAGVALGQVVWTVAAAVGIASLVAASRPAFVGLQLAGAAYLVLLGARTLIRALRGGAGREPHAGEGRSVPGLRHGFWSNIANPKMAVFFTTLLPQFAPDGRLAFPTLLVLGLLFSAMTFTWLACYALAVARMRQLLLRDRARRALEAITGAMLVALGARLAVHRA
jgi:threonine/homoserine/homoserine lactone efflux protein